MCSKQIFLGRTPGILRPAKTQLRVRPPVYAMRNSQKTVSGVKRGQYRQRGGPVRLVAPSHDRGFFHGMIAKNFFSFFSIRGGRLGGLLRRRKRCATWRSASARGNGSGLRSSRRRAVYTPLRGVIRPPRGFEDRQPALHRRKTVVKSKKVNDFATAHFKSIPIFARQPALHRGTGS